MSDDLLIKGDGILKIFSRWRDTWRLYKYVKFIKREIVTPTRNPTSHEADKIVNKIISIGIGNLIVGPHMIHGTLNDGNKFCFWNNNFWYAWGSHGQVGNDYWDGDDERSTELIVNEKCSSSLPNKIPYCPSSICLYRLRNYLLSIDSKIFYDLFLNKIDIFNYEKSYDLTEFNRDQKLQRILNG